MTSLISSWSKACDVPPDYRRDKVEVRTAIRYVNSFRNRLAHVPFPHDPLGEVADALESATEQLFSIAPVPSCHEKGGQSSPLTGAFRINRCFLRGGQMDSLPEGHSDQIQFIFPCRKRSDDNEVWSGKAMLHLDSMMRPHILTRVKGHDVCEYTRFRAEANAVIVQVDGGIVLRLPEPAKAEYVVPEEVVEVPSLTRVVPGGSQPPVSEPLSMSDAIEAIRSEDYDTAIKFFEALTREKPNYHIGWLRLGYARREKAVRLAPNEPTTAIEILTEAVESLSRAAEHVDPAYQALALYERSKSRYHLARLKPEDDEIRQACLADAKEASSISDEKKFFTWSEHVQRFHGGFGGSTEQ